MIVFVMTRILFYEACFQTKVKELNMREAFISFLFNSSKILFQQQQQQKNIMLKRKKYKLGRKSKPKLGEKMKNKHLKDNLS